MIKDIHRIVFLSLVFINFTSCFHTKATSSEDLIKTSEVLSESSINSENTTIILENTTERIEEVISDEDRDNINKMNDAFNKIPFKCSINDLRSLLGDESSSGEVIGGSSYTWNFGEKYKITCEFGYIGLYKKYKDFDKNAIPKVREDKIEALKKVSFSKNTAENILGEGFLYVDMIGGHGADKSDTKKYLYRSYLDDKIYIMDYYHESCIGGIMEFNK